MEGERKKRRGGLVAVIVIVLLLAAVCAAPFLYNYMTPYGYEDMEALAGEAEELFALYGAWTTLCWTPRRRRPAAGSPWKSSAIRCNRNPDSWRFLPR